jgi:hypothetical protein
MSHILGDTYGQTADIQVKFRKDDQAMETGNRRIIINRKTEVKICRWNMREKNKGQIGPVLT